jgi:pullulanase/glycogen debranching enzyme
MKLPRYLLSLAVLALLTSISAPTIAQTSISAGSVRIHYLRKNADYAGWTIYDWTGAKNPSPSWQNPGTPPPVSDDFGVHWDIALADGATQLLFIVRNADGSVKNCQSDMVLDISKGLEIWLRQDDCKIYTTKPRTDLVGNIKAAHAYWVNRDTLAWFGAQPTNTYQLYYSPDAGIIDVATSGVEGDGKSIPLTVDPNGLSPTIIDKFPFLKGATAFKIAQSQLGQVPSLLKDQLVLVKFHGAQPADATALQLPGVLDDLFYFDGRLGAHFADDAVRFRLWAPTAQKVQLFVYDDPNGTVPTIYPMIQKDRGIWETKAGDYSWVNHKYYLYEVTVFSRTEGQVVTNVVTDPYSLGLAADSVKSLVVDLNSPLTKPFFWNLIPKPPLASPTDIVLYELHIRDFSISDNSVPEKDRGKYTAFTDIFSRGMQHLRSLANAGLTHVHLLPAFSFSSVPELASEQKIADITIPISAPDSTQPETAIAAVKDQDGFNWGYDPYHYGTPQGSYSTDPNGITRIREFREMVESLHSIGLRVVMDVVYTHTSAAGHSVLDKVVPGYYYRLDDNGDIYTNTCCPDTASEHRMFFKLMLDTLKIWAKDYHVDGFRFDLMSFSFKNNLLDIQKALHEIDPTIYLYGEGWNFGEVGNDALGINATQENMAGTGIGTFSDRGRDAIRGGSFFDSQQSLVANQGFINGLWYDSNGSSAATLQQLLDTGDLVKLALAGTIKDYQLVDDHGDLVTGSQLNYDALGTHEHVTILGHELRPRRARNRRGKPAGYTLNPPDVINYISSHDSQTLFDNNQYKIPMATTMFDRVRVNNLGMALVGLAQGIPFFHAGDDILRSKSFDKNSYNSGDWFNKLDWTYQTNNFAVGLPQAADNQGDWSTMDPFLVNPALKPGFTSIYSAHLYFEDILRIRKSSPLFRLQTGDEVKQRVKFYNVGASQQPALIVMAISDKVGRKLDPNAKSIVVLFNVDKITKTISLPDYAGIPLELHPILRNSIADFVVKQSRYNAPTGTFTIPPRTTTVFLER